MSDFFQCMAALNLTEEAESRKLAGTELFKNQDWIGAAECYTEAIALDPFKGVFYSNRAACYAHLGRYRLVVIDSKKAVNLDPTIFKAWARLGKTLHEHFQDLPGSIAGYDKAISIVPRTGHLKGLYEAERKVVFDKLWNVDHIPMEILRAHARAHDVPIPTTGSIESQRRAIYLHSAMANPPEIRYYLFPESQDAPLREIQIAEGPDLKAKIVRIIGCGEVCMETLYDEDQVAKLRDPESDGVQIGKLFTSYDIFLDSDHVTFATTASEDSLIPIPFTSRIPNPRAFNLLRRFALQGPILLTKSTFLKIGNEREGVDHFSNRGELVCSERVSVTELRGEEFRKRREEWDEALEVWMRAQTEGGEDGEGWDGKVPHRQWWSPNPLMMHMSESGHWSM